MQFAHNLFSGSQRLHLNGDCIHELPYKYELTGILRFKADDEELVELYMRADGERWMRDGRACWSSSLFAGLGRRELVTRSICVRVGVMITMAPPVASLPPTPTLQMTATSSMC